MKKLTSSESLITINHYRNLLAAEGIRTKIRNEHLGSILGEMPFVEVWPELWIVNDLDFDRAKQLVESIETESETTPWTCARCGEVNEGQFAVCWNCGDPADSDA
ncbi:MAG TPA: DUF2007 domain-containing protein [Woeseiaceae bacterium]